MNPLAYSAEKVASAVRSGELSALDYLEAILERLRSVEPKLNAFITVTEELARRKAESIDRRVEKGLKVGKLAGVVVAVKDNICVKDVETTCGSRILKGYRPSYNATVVERLIAEDAVIIGKTNMDEFAMGSSTEFSAYGPTRNPWDLERVPGGSSGGSGAAVASGEATLALGSDTGGSVRCPAAFCGVVGLKPTYGLVSRYGLVAYANSLEQIGPMARSVRDCALLLSVIAGHDPRDSTSLRVQPVDYWAKLVDPPGLEGIRVGVIREFMGEGVQEGVREKVWEAVHSLESLGAHVGEVSLKSLDYALAAYYVIAMSEASSNLARYDGLRYGFRSSDQGLDWNRAYAKTRRWGFGEEVKRRIILGTFALSAGYYEAYYLKALKVRTLIRMEFEKAFKRFDVLVGPSMPMVAFKIGEKVEDPLELYMCDINTVPANLVGIPAISVPCGLSDGLPVGLQVMAPPLREDLVFKVAYAYERTGKWMFQLKP
ncbi:Asp-tRNA(Asn)/Glu-tRNA(Gln) amidotransferase GatCAB subunit A [Candidatus Bathyarchaeota archaeon]|nr:MAG: Asp-tRNA(Asn)/Glu-tRNA(Gln) amidotransferase GatCAB subunit A [Candidatus Bathyarchaeota archaeon]